LPKLAVGIAQAVQDFGPLLVGHRGKQQAAGFEFTLASQEKWFLGAGSEALKPWRVLRSD
jgi:hypothetical protein